MFYGSKVTETGHVRNTTVNETISVCITTVNKTSNLCRTTVVYTVLLSQGLVVYAFLKPLILVYAVLQCVRLGRRIVVQSLNIVVHI